MFWVESSAGKDIRGKLKSRTNEDYMPDGDEPWRIVVPLLARESAKQKAGYVQ